MRTFSTVSTLAGCLLLAACISLELAPYDSKAYDNATRAKATTLAFIKQSGASCKFTEDAQNKLSLELDIGFEYANGVPHNEESAANWDDLRSSLVANYFTACRDAGSLSPLFLQELTEQITAGFDSLICLEANKDKLTECG